MWHAGWKLRVRVLSFHVGCRVALLVLFIFASHAFDKCIVLISIHHAYKWFVFVGSIICVVSDINLSTSLLKPETTCRLWQFVNQVMVIFVLGLWCGKCVHHRTTRAYAAYARVFDSLPSICGGCLMSNVVRLRLDMLFEWDRKI